MEQENPTSGAKGIPSLGFYSFSRQSYNLNRDKPSSGNVGTLPLGCSADLWRLKGFVPHITSSWLGNTEKWLHLKLVVERKFMQVKQTIEATQICDCKG